jgi:hypothetical protein
MTLRKIPAEQSSSDGWGVDSGRCFNPPEISGTVKSADVASSETTEGTDSMDGRLGLSIKNNNAQRARNPTMAIGRMLLFDRFIFVLLFITARAPSLCLNSRRLNSRGSIEFDTMDFFLVLFEFCLGKTFYLAWPTNSVPDVRRKPCHRLSPYPFHASALPCAAMFSASIRRVHSAIFWQLVQNL